MSAAGDQSGEMGDVDDEKGADRVANGAETLEVPMARIGRAAGDDQLRLVLARQRLDLIHVDPMRRPVDPVGDRFEPAAGHVDRRTMGQVPARSEIEAHEDVAGLHQGHEDALIGLAAGVRLDVGEAAVEQSASALDRHSLRDVDELAAAVVAPAGIAFGIFVGHDRALRLEHGARHDVFRGDELDPVALTAKLEFDRAGDLRIGGGEGRGKERVRTHSERGGNVHRQTFHGKRGLAKTASGAALARAARPQKGDEG